MWKRTRESLKSKQNPQQLEIKRNDLEMLELAASAGEIYLKYLDESGFNLWAEPLYTWAKIGKQKRIEQPKNKGRRLNICGLLEPGKSFEYGLALKSNDWKTFSRCSQRLFLLFSSFTSKGATDYQAGLYCSMRLQYWEAAELPIMDLLQLNHTVFSEESGEIALGTSTTTSTDIWQACCHKAILAADSNAVRPTSLCCTSS